MKIDCGHEPLPASGRVGIPVALATCGGIAYMPPDHGAGRTNLPKDRCDGKDHLH